LTIITRTKDYETIALLNEQVHQVHAELCPEHFKPYHYEAVRDFFQSIIEKPQFVFLLLEHDGKPLGYAWIEVKQYLENAFRKAYRSVFIHQLSISSGHRNNGHGTTMMDYIGQFARENGIHKIELDYWASNEHAAKFYEKNGFQVYRQFVFKDIAPG